MIIGGDGLLKAHDDRVLYYFNQFSIFFGTLKAQKIQKVGRKTLEGLQVGVVTCDRQIDRNGTVICSEI